MPKKMKSYFYQGDSTDLEQLLYEVGGWAQNWNDVLWYLETVAPHNKSFTPADVTAMKGYVEQLHRAKQRFTTDYREIYQALTGRECDGCAVPDQGRFCKLPLRKIAEKWLEGLCFPSSPEEFIDRAKANHAPPHILDALRGGSKSQYPNVGILLQEISRQPAARR